MLILLHGDDSYRSRQRLKQLEDAFRAKYDAAGINIAQLDGTNLTPERFNEHIRAGGFLASRRFVRVTGVLTAGAKATQEAIAGVLQEKGTDDETIVVFWEGQEVAAKTTASSLVPYLLSTARVEQFPPLTPAQAEQWVVKEATRRGGIIEKKAAGRLAAIVGSDLWAASAELEKLLHFREGQLITEADVDLLVAGSVEANIFRLTDAVGERDEEGALRALEEHFADGADPLYLLRMFGWHLRNLNAGRALLDAGRRDSRALAKLLNLHPFVAQKTLRQAERFPRPVLTWAYDELVAMDTRLKTTRTDPRALFDLLVIGLVRQSSGKRVPAA